MATIVVLKNAKTGEKVSKYSADAREMIRQDENWQFDKRLGRTAKMIESGVAAQAKEGDPKHMEFHGDAILQDDAKKAVEPKVEDPIGADLPEAPQGSRGGGKQEPAKVKSDKG